MYVVHLTSILVCLKPMVPDYQHHVTGMYLVLWQKNLMIVIEIMILACGVISYNKAGHDVIDEVPLLDNDLFPIEETEAVLE